MRLKSQKYVMGESILNALAFSLYISHKQIFTIHESYYYQCFQEIMSSVSTTATNVSKGNGVILPISSTTINGLWVMFSRDYVIFTINGLGENELKSSPVTITTTIRKNHWFAMKPTNNTKVYHKWMITSHNYNCSVSKGLRNKSINTTVISQGVWHYK